jgi:hypothetical protein
LNQQICLEQFERDTAIDRNFEIRIAACCDPSRGDESCTHTLSAAQRKISRRVDHRYDERPVDTCSFSDRIETLTDASVDLRTQTAKHNEEGVGVLRI